VTFLVVIDMQDVKKTRQQVCARLMPVLAAKVVLSFRRFAVDPIISRPPDRVVKNTSSFYLARRSRPAGHPRP